MAIPADRAGDSTVGEDPGKGRLDTSPPKGAPLLHKVVNQETASVFLNIYFPDCTQGQKAAGLCSERGADRSET